MPPGEPPEHMTIVGFPVQHCHPEDLLTLESFLGQELSELPGEDGFLEDEMS